MKRFSIRYGIALAVVLGVGTMYVGRPGAQQLQQRQAIQVTKIAPLAGAALARSILNCPGAPASATVTMGAGSTGVSQVSGLNYGSDTCNRYVLDINVPSTSTPPAGYQPPFGLWGKDNNDMGIGTGGITQSDCPSAHVDVTVYKKANGATSFSQIYTARYNGTWVGESPGDNFGENSCHLNIGTQSGNAANLTAPSAGTDTYRVAVRSYTSTSLRKVKAGASRVQNPPS